MTFDEYWEETYGANARLVNYYYDESYKAHCKAAWCAGYKQRHSEEHKADVLDDIKVITDNIREAINGTLDKLEYKMTIEVK